MPSELRPVVKAFGLRRGRSGTLDGHIGQAGEADVVATTTGIGTEPATAATRRMLDGGRVDHVVVVGIAGAIGPTVAVRDLVIPELVVDWPEGREHRPAPLGPLVGAGTIVTSDEYGYPPEVIADFVARGVVAVDMETVAVARVCAEAGVPWSVVRAISDRADDETVDQEVISLVKPDGSPDLGQSLRYLVRHPGRISRLAALGRDASAAARAAASAAATACATHSVGA
jgi:adenosylhomocysteine nucleosidase